MILDNSRISQAMMADELNISVRAVKKSMKELIEMGMIERVGSSRNGIWNVKIKAKNDLL